MQNTTEEILQRLKLAGLKFTGKRREAVDFFVQHKDKYMSAKDLHEHLKKMFSNISYDTVYRTLTTLLENNIIEHMEFRGDAARYRLMCHDEHHHHLVCLGCGSTFPLDACPMTSITSSIQDFQVTNHRFEVYGYCSNCQAAS
jgi:Fur family transcriptional regulator, zinc uptake regulator